MRKTIKLNKLNQGMCKENKEKNKIQLNILCLKDPFWKPVEGQ